MGAWVIHDDKGEGWLFSIVFSAIFALMFTVLKYFLSRKATAVSDKPEIQVIIGRDKILLDGKLYSVRDEERWLDEIKIKNDDGQSLLEFTYCWNTRSGPTNDFLLIPVPSGKMEEASRVVSELRRLHQIK